MAGRITVGELAGVISNPPDTRPCGDFVALPIRECHLAKAKLAECLNVPLDWHVQTSRTRNPYLGDAKDLRMIAFGEEVRNMPAAKRPFGLQLVPNERVGAVEAAPGDFDREVRIKERILRRGHELPRLETFLRRDFEQVHHPLPAVVDPAPDART